MLEEPHPIVTKKLEASCWTLSYTTLHLYGLYAPWKTRFPFIARYRKPRTALKPTISMSLPCPFQLIGPYFPTKIQTLKPVLYAPHIPYMVVT